MTRTFALFVATVVPAAIVGCATPGPADTDRQAHVDDGQRTPTGGDPYHDLIQYRAKDAKEAILEPELVSAQEAMIAGGTKVIGVNIKGDARAYPLFILNNHQVVNDRVGGIPLSASW
ncbi:MAG: DUF3179 domain-containing protein [Planctomycetes bacterium]|nr:DUF3179 domain-containing protein [Planctomycetota bacterium]